MEVGTVSSVLLTALWGFLVGFSGGWEIPRNLLTPWTTWLLQRAESKGISAIEIIVRVVLILFFIFALLAILCFMPALMVAKGVMQHGMAYIESLAWSDLWGASFVGSFVGWFTMGFLRRFQCRGSRKRK
jgi:hypothetical protein